MDKIIILSREELLAILQENNDAQIMRMSEVIKNLSAPKNEKITVAEAAKLLNVTKLTIRNYIKKGRIKAKKIGRRILIERIDLEQSLSEIKSLKYRR